MAPGMAVPRHGVPDEPPAVQAGQVFPRHGVRVEPVEDMAAKALFHLAVRAFGGEIKPLARIVVQVKKSRLETVNVAGVEDRLPTTVAVSVPVHHGVTIVQVRGKGGQVYLGVFVPVSIVQGRPEGFVGVV